MTLDHWVAHILGPFAFWVLINGLDDLVIDIAAVAGYLTQPRAPTEAELDAVPPRLMAIFVASWKEHRVIRKMVENNVTKLRYPNVAFFLGVYPNDAPTVAAARDSEASFPNVHLSVCPHDGPTSKADCLNWIYQRMLLFEEQNNVRFEMVLTHDAEDLIDPDALRWINYYAQWNDMVQIPVLALPTEFSKISHGVYCDEFAEYQFRDVIGRQFLGGFIPSNGVGTGFSRRALEALAAESNNRIFEPGCLTEDYENGFRVARLGMKQKFIPINFRQGRPIATREFFPLGFRKAVAQRSRWITGINLQSWGFHDARETFRHIYWFWRDRKGLVGNLVTPLSNLLFVYGLFTLLLAKALHHPWGLAYEASSLTRACEAGVSLQVLHIAARMWFSSRIYGWRHAATVPIRVVAGNWINCFATCVAIWTFTQAKIHRSPLVWVKTEHAYPNRAALMTDRKRLGEILVFNQWITPEQLEYALVSKPAGRRLGQHLMEIGLITEQNLYLALSFQNNLPFGKPDPGLVSTSITRALPAALSRKWKVLPFRIAAGELYVAGSYLPGEEMQSDIRRFSTLELRFHLVTPTEYDELARQYLE